MTENSNEKDDQQLNINVLSDDIQDDIKFYNSNYNKIRSEVLNVVKENQRLSQKIEDLQSQDISNLNSLQHNRLTKDAIDNLKNQVALLFDEKETFQCLWKISEDTIRNLENEVIQYRKQLNQPETASKIRAEFTALVTMLESIVDKLKAQLLCEKESNRFLTEEKFTAEQKCIAIECRYKKLLLKHTTTINYIKQMEESLNATKLQIQNTIKEKTDCEKQLFIADNTMRECMEREKKAFAQLQNALSCVENALAEKKEAMERENGIREECDFLAKNIGEVMEEAAERVDKNVAAMKKQHNEKVQNLEATIGQLRMSLEEEQRNRLCLKQNAQLLEETLKTTMQKNCSLDSELQIASKTIVEMELRLDVFEKILAKEQETYRICDKNTQEMRDFLINSKQIKERWKETIEDVTTKLRLEIRNLLDQNVHLVNENRALNAKILQQQ